VFTETTQIVDRSGGLQIAQTTVKYACDERVQLISEKTESDVDGQKSTSEFKFRTIRWRWSTPLRARKGKLAYAFTKVYTDPATRPQSSTIHFCLVRNSRR
jgi:hypothetical protein